MTHPRIVDRQREDDLLAFEEIFGRLEGVEAHHLEALARSKTTTGLRSQVPRADDPIASGAYTAAALRGLAAAVAAMQGRDSDEADEAMAG